MRVLAVATVALMLLASAYLLYEHWRDSSDVIFIRVIDAGSGRTVEYRAQRGDIKEREFLTTDGRRIVLAETERLEDLDHQIAEFAGPKLKASERRVSRLAFSSTSCGMSGGNRTTSPGLGVTMICASSSCRIRRPLFCGHCR